MQMELVGGPLDGATYPVSWRSVGPTIEVVIPWHVPMTEDDALAQLVEDVGGTARYRLRVNRVASGAVPLMPATTMDGDLVYDYVRPE